MLKNIPNKPISRNVPVSVYQSVCPPLRDLEPHGLETSVQRMYCSNFKSKKPFFGKVWQIFFGFWVNKLIPKIKKFCFSKTSLLCIVGELEGGGYVAVAVSVGDR